MCWNKLTSLWACDICSLAKVHLIRGQEANKTFPPCLSRYWGALTIWEIIDLWCFSLCFSYTLPLHWWVHAFLVIRTVDYSLTTFKGEIWGLELSRLSWNIAEVKTLNSGEDLCNPTISSVSKEGFSIKATAAVRHRSPNGNPRSSGSGLINTQITAAQLSRLKAVFSPALGGRLS